MANLEELDVEDLQMFHDALIYKLADYKELEKPACDRVDVLLIGRLLRQIDLAMEVAEEEKRSMIHAGNLDLFERRKAGNE
jgi:hypothetical protein